MNNRNKIKYRKIKNISKKKINKLSIIEIAKRSLKRKLNNKKRTNLKGKINVNKKTKIKSKFKERTKLLLDGKKITRKVSGGGQRAPRAPKAQMPRTKAIANSRTTYQTGSPFFKKTHFVDGPEIKSARNPFKTSSGRIIAIQQGKIEVNSAKLTIKKSNINNKKKELEDLLSDPTPDNINRVKKIKKELKAEENSLEELKKKIETGKKELDRVKTKQTKKYQGFKHRYKFKKYSTKNLDSTLKRLESGKYSYTTFSRGRYNVLKNMDYDDRIKLRENLDKINELKEKKKNGETLSEEDSKRMRDLKTENANLYRRGMLKQKINSAYEDKFFNRLDLTKAKKLESILEENKRENKGENKYLTQNFMKEADLKVKLEKLEKIRNKPGAPDVSSKITKINDKLKKLTDPDTYVNELIKKAETNINSSEKLSEGIRKELEGIDQTKTNIAVSNVQEALDQRRIDRIEKASWSRFTQRSTIKKLSKTVSELKEIINDNKSTKEQVKNAKESLEHILIKSDIAKKSRNKELQKERTELQNTRTKNLRKNLDILKSPSTIKKTESLITKLKNFKDKEDGKTREQIEMIDKKLIELYNHYGKLTKLDELFYQKISLYEQIKKAKNNGEDTSALDEQIKKINNQQSWVASLPVKTRN